MRRTDGPTVRRSSRLLRLAPVLLLAMLARPSPSAAADADAAAVRRGFDAYRQALERRDGAAAAAAVSSNSLDYYDRMRRLALRAPREELAQLAGTERMLVLSLRHSAPRELLAAGSPGDLLAYAVDAGLVSETGVARTQLGEITIHENRARCWIVIDGDPTRGVMQFVHEDDRWKFDLEFAMRASEGLIAALAAQSGMTEDGVILELLSQGDAAPVDATIWDPLVEP